MLPCRTAIPCQATIGYSKVRMAFDGDRPTSSPIINMNMNMNLNGVDAAMYGAERNRVRSSSDITTSSFGGGLSSSGHGRSAGQTPPGAVVGGTTNVAATASSAGAGGSATTHAGGSTYTFASNNSAAAAAAISGAGPVRDIIFQSPPGNSALGTNSNNNSNSNSNGNSNGTASGWSTPKQQRKAPPTNGVSMNTPLASNAYTPSHRSSSGALNIVTPQSLGGGAGMATPTRTYQPPTGEGGGGGSGGGGGGGSTVNTLAYNNYSGGFGGAGSAASTPRSHNNMGSSNSNSNNAYLNQGGPIIGDVAEPFWVQPVEPGQGQAHANAHELGHLCSWCDPDEHFFAESKRIITEIDKKIFWEMARTLLDLPELFPASGGTSTNGDAPSNKTTIRTMSDLTNILKRSEYRIMWQADAPNYIPKEVATELLKAAYVSPVGIHNL
jgi:hypothetical protein